MSDWPLRKSPADHGTIAGVLVALAGSSGYVLLLAGYAVLSAWARGTGGGTASPSSLGLIVLTYGLVFGVLPAGAAGLLAGTAIGRLLDVTSAWQRPVVAAATGVVIGSLLAGVVNVGLVYIWGGTPPLGSWLLVLGVPSAIFVAGNAAVAVRLYRRRIAPLEQA